MLAVVFVALLTLGPAAPDARAQAVRPPKVEAPEKAPKWLYYLIGVGSIAVCVGLAVFPSRRTHED